MEQFETLLKESPVGACLLDSSLRLSGVNPAALPVFANRVDFIGRDFDEVAHILWRKEYADEIVNRFRRTLETGQPAVTIEEHMEWRVSQIPWSEGRCGLVAYVRDLSGEVQARAEVTRSEERFRAFVTASSDVIYQMNADWTEMRHLEGRQFIPDADGPTQSWVEKYIHPDDRLSVMQAVRQAIRTKSVFELEHRVVRIDGTLGWTFSRAVPLLNSLGEITEWFGTASDVSEEKKSAEAVARLTRSAEFQKRFYETILATTPDLVYVFGLDHRFTYANPALLAMWGMTAEEAIGKNCLELGYEPWHAAMHDREIEQVIATRKPIRGDVPFSGTNGRRIYDYIFVPVVGPTGEVEAIAGTTRDVTERHSVEEELRRANEDLQQFAYASTHDLQEPLRTMKVYSEILQRRYTSRLDGEALECLRFVTAGAVRMEHLIRDLLSYTKAGSEQLTVELADANSCLETALANLAASIAESGAEIIFQPLPTVRIHHTQLQQIFQNLVGNALKYRRPDLAPAIKISAKLNDADWQFTVADNGIGIEEQHRKHIFGLFKRLHSSDKYSGTGIGLALCQRIVERNNGRIWVESEPGQSSEFHFTLPA